MTVKISTPKCPKCDGSEFELWIQKEESVGCAKCWRCKEHFLLFDSQDYWFDIIAKGYPRKSRCSCKEYIFTIRVLYELRDDGDVKAIKMWTTCRACELDKLKLTVKIDYSETDSLIDHPLIYCANPEIQYKLYEASLYATPEDIAEIAAHLVQGSFIPCGYLWKNGKPTKTSEDPEEIYNAIKNDKYSFIYFAPRKLDWQLIESLAAKQEEQFWKRNELIRISAATRMHFHDKVGRLYFIKFSTEFIQPDATVLSKSPEFTERANVFLKWLESKYYGARGPLCFDNKEEHYRLFDDKFKKSYRDKA